MEDAKFEYEFWGGDFYEPPKSPEPYYSELTGMTVRTEPPVRSAYSLTLNMLQNQLPDTVGLMRLEKHSFFSPFMNRWTLTFRIVDDPIAKEVFHDVEGILSRGGNEVYSECPHQMLLTKVRVFL